MAIFCEYKNKLAFDLGSILRRAILPSEITVTDPVPAPAGSGRSWMVEATHAPSGEKRTFVYDRQDIAQLFVNVPRPFLTVNIATAVTSIREVVPYLAAQFGLPLKPEDVVDGYVTSGTVNVTITMEPTALTFTGSLKVTVYNGEYSSDVPQPEHEFLFAEGGLNTGMSEIPLTANLATFEAHGRTWVRNTSGAQQALGADLKFKISGDYTLDFEILCDRDDYGYVTLFGVPDATGALTLYGGKKIYEYLVTPTGMGPSNDWFANVPDAKKDVPMRVTIRSRNGYSSIWIDGKFCTHYLAAAAGVSRFLTVISSPSGYGIANLRCWEIGLDNAQLASLLGKAKDTLLPKHFWPLDGRSVDLGRHASPWLAPMSYVEYGHKKWAVSASSAGAAFGAELDVGRDHTFQFEVFNPTLSIADIEGMFTTATLGDVNHHIKFVRGHLFLGGADQAWSTLGKLNKREKRTLTVVKEGTTAHCWADDVYLGPATVPVNSTVLTHFGKATQVLTTAWGLSNIKYWDRALTVVELRQLLGPNLALPETVLGLANRSGDVNIIDGNAGTVFNVQRDPVVIGEFGQEQGDRYIYGVYFYFVVDGTNYLKKLRNIAIDKWVNGAWVSQGARATQYVRQGTPSRDFLQFETPIRIDPIDRRIRVRGIGNWGDPNGYRWCSEITFQMNAELPQVSPSLEDWWANLSGDTSLLGFFNDVYTPTPYSQPREGVVEATLPARLSGRVLKRLDFRFSSAAADFANKARYIHVDSWNGTEWVERVKIETLKPAENCPINESYVLQNPIALPDGKVRFRVSGNHGTTSTVSCYDITPYFEIAQ